MRFILAILVFFLYVLVLPISEGLGFTNLVFVDGVTWLNAIDEINNDSILSIFDMRAAWLIYLIYCPIVAITGAYGVIVFNAITYAYSLKYCRNILSLFAVCLTFLFFLVNGALPNKEILSLVCSVLFFYWLNSGAYIKLLMVAIVQFLIRDGMGYTFLIILPFLYKDLCNKKILFLIFISLQFLDLFMFDLQESLNLFVLDRTIGYFLHNGIDWVIYALRVGANSIGLLTRVPLMTESGLFSFASFTLFLSGYVVMAAVVISFLRIVKHNKLKPIVNYKESFSFVLILLVTSMSPMIQPRYLIPISVAYIFSTKNISRFEVLAIFFVAILCFIVRVYFINSTGFPITTEFSHKVL